MGDLTYLKQYVPLQIQREKSSAQKRIVQNDLFVLFRPVVMLFCSGLYMFLLPQWNIVTADIINNH